MLEKKLLIPETFTADPSVHVFNGKLYIYPSHDRDADFESNDNGDQYMMEDYHVYEMADTETMPKDCGMILHLRDIPWAKEQLWAPDCGERDGKYYFYFPARDKQGFFRIGVAVSSNPDGPFTVEPEPIKNSYSIDPCIFADDDGSYYLTFGGLWGGQLDKYRDNVYNEAHKEPTGSIPALGARIAKMQPNMKEFAETPREVIILDKSGKPIEGADHDRRYFEAPCQFKRNGIYYFTYSTGDTHNICWATSDNVYGPYTYGGILLKPVIGWTNHHYCVEFRGKWYLFYHDCERSKGVNHQRDVKFCSLNFNEDGSIQTVTP